MTEYKEVRQRMARELYALWRQAFDCLGRSLPPWDAIEPDARCVWFQEADRRILSDPGIAVLVKDRSFPQNPYGIHTWNHDLYWDAQVGLYEANFRRIVEKPKEESR